MAEKTDAFGNPIGPQQAQGVPGGPTVGGARRPSESGLPDTKSATTGVPQQYDTQLASSGPQASNESFGRSRSVSFGTISLAIFLFIIVVGVGLVVALGAFGGAKNAYNDVKDSVNDSVNSASSTGSSDATGISGGSLFAGSNFGEAKKLLERSGQGDPRLIALRPNRVDAQLLNGGTLANVEVKAGGDSAKIISTSPGSSALKTFKLSAIGDEVPSRVVRRASKKLGQSTGNIDYIVVVDVINGVQINGFFKDGEHFSANRNGGDVQKVG